MSLLAALAIAGIATSGAARVDRDPLAGRIAGAPANCVSGSPSEGLTIAGPDTVMLSRTAQRLWVAKAIGCPALRPTDTLVVEHLGGSGYCRGDRIRTVSPGLSIPGPTCRLGDFTPYDKQR